jgi:hypothetical protein
LAVGPTAFTDGQLDKGGEGAGVKEFVYLLRLIAPRLPKAPPRVERKAGSLHSNPLKLNLSAVNTPSTSWMGAALRAWLTTAEKPAGAAS